MEGVHDAIAQFVAQERGRRTGIIRIREVPNASQGASGSQIRMYTVQLKGGVPLLHVVTKHATILERQVIGYLGGLKAALPPHLIVEAEEAAERSLVVMLQADLQQARPGVNDIVTVGNARALADIHLRTLYDRPAWLPRGTIPNLYLDPWRDVWCENLKLPDFAREFGPYTDRLERKFSQFWGELTALYEEDRTVCLINADLHPTHMRMCASKPCFIDWEQSRLGPFYLDLVNYFSKETALAYRDALAALGHEIPVMDFLDRFHSMGRYMGFRYLSVGLNAWRQRPADWPAQRWFLYYCLELALNGR